MYFLIKFRVDNENLFCFVLRSNDDYFYCSS